MEEELGFDDTENVLEEPETIEFAGETYIVLPKSETEFGKLDPRQSAAVGKIYEVLSNMLPLEGRDYTFKVDFPSGDATNPRIQMEPKNELGTLWCTYLSKHMAEEMAKRNKEKGEQNG